MYSDFHYSENTEVSAWRPAANASTRRAVSGLYVVLSKIHQHYRVVDVNMKSKFKDVEKENGKISRPDENHFKSLGPRDLQTR